MDITHISLCERLEGKIGVFRSKIDDGTWVILQEQQPNYKVSGFHFGERIPRIPILLSFLDCIYAEINLKLSRALHENIERSRHMNFDNLLLKNTFMNRKVINGE